MGLLKDKGPDYLIQISRGYWLSQTLFVAHRLGLFELLAQGPRSPDEVSSHLDLDPGATTIFLTTLTGLGLLTKTNGQQYKNSSLTNQCLVKDGQCYLGDFISHSEHMKSYWEGLAQVLKSGQPAISNSFTGPDMLQITLFLRAMEQATRLVAPEIVANLDLEGKNHLLDLGSGLAPITRLLLARYPHLHATLFDLPHIIKMIKGELLMAPNIQGRVLYKEGDCRYEDYGDRIYDAILMSNLIHMYDPETNNTIFARAYKALKPKGGLILHDYVLTDDCTIPCYGALFSLNMLVGTWGGKNYFREEIQTSLEIIGFYRLQMKPLKGGTSLIIAIK